MTDRQRQVCSRFWLVGVTMLALIVPAVAHAQARGAASEVLTNQSVISMTMAKLNRDLLINKINTTPNTFDITVNGIVALYQGKVHQDVIKTMITMAADPKLGARNRKPETIDNRSVVTMISMKVPKVVVLAKIQNTKSDFDTSSTGLVNLTQNKVPADVIKAMVAKTGGD